MPRRRTERSTVGPDAARRATRTLFQVGTVTALIQLYNVMVGDQRQLNADQVAAVTTVGTILVSLIQNLLEENGAVPEMLKRPSAPVPPTDAPSDDDLAVRKFEAMAAAIGGQHERMERIENALLDLRADRHDPEPEDPERISTRQLVPEVPFRG
jgi:hypothetical protein